jgi:hypothetical protein
MHRRHKQCFFLSKESNYADKGGAGVKEHKPRAAYNADDLQKSPSVCENQSRSGSWSNLLIFIT